MAKILAGAGRITGLGPEIGGKIILGLQSAYVKRAGRESMRFVALIGRSRIWTLMIWLSCGSDALITELWRGRCRSLRFRWRNGW
jgi:hypothetical protein